MTPTRRDLLAWSGGLVGGMLFTPVPWKVLDDVSIWSQNWPWIPQPARGPVEEKLSSCTLCPNACGLRVRMAAGSPVGLAGMAGHPVSRGALCPLGFGAHQLNWHPSRLQSALHRGRKAGWEEAAAAFRKALAEGPIAVIDGRTGRAASTVLERFAAAHGGSYAAARTAEEKALGPYQRWSGVPASALGYDLENARTIVSFGAPLLDGWATPGRFTRLWSERAAGAADPALRLIQVEPVQSRTAAFAWRWVALRMGSESALASALARVLMEERLVAARGPMPPESLSDATAKTGLAPETIQNLARALVERGPVVAISAGDNPSVAALNVILGAVGARGGIVRRSGATKSPVPVEALTGRMRAVLIDSTVPWEVTPNLDAEVFRFAAWHGGTTTADWLLPAPGFLEALTDVPTPPGSAIETYAVAAPLISAAEGSKDAARFLAEIDPGAGSVEDAIKARCEAIYRGGKGMLIKPEPEPLKSIGSAKKLYEEFGNGAVWSNEPAIPGGLRCGLKEWPYPSGMESPAGWTADWAAPVLPPLAAKLYRESDLRAAPARSDV
ncbi:MAG: hypothetical protein ABSH45_00460 [Bryobacteraceae bacterium]